MTYSYISSVFPNYEVSKLYDDNVYNNIMKSKAPVSLTKNVVPYGETSFQNFNVVNSKVVEGFESTAGLESKTAGLESKTVGLESKTTSLESTECNNHVIHIMECKECQEILRTQLKIDAQEIFEQRRNEEFMELGSYVLFGIFIILILEFIEKRQIRS